MGKQKSSVIAADPVVSVAAPVLDLLDGSTVVTAAPAVVAVSPFANFPHSYSVTLDAIAVILTREPRASMTEIGDAFAALATLRPVKTVLDSYATREEKFEARDNYKADVALHQRALREAFGLARDAGAVVAEKFAGSILTSGAVSIRQTVTAKLAPAKRNAVRL